MAGIGMLAVDMWYSYLVGCRPYTLSSVFPIFTSLKLNS